MNNRTVITAPIPTQKESEIESAPDVIEITISEVDRQTAGHFINNNDCLICAAGKNRGLNISGVVPTSASVDDEQYEIMDGTGDSEYLHSLEEFAVLKRAPFYGPEVVGKVIRMRKRFPDEGKKAK